MKKLLAIAFAFVTASTASAAAQTYPAKPVTAGSPLDTRARSLAEHMRLSLGQADRHRKVSAARLAVLAPVGSLAQHPKR